jgi:hypothetical protein
MSWSFSQHITFKECSRKWYFSYKLANPISTKELIRKEAFYLKQLKNIDAWRGIIVDKIISEKIIPSVSNKSPITLDKSITEARKSFDNQLFFAKERKWRNGGVKKADNDYAVLWEIEKGDDIKEPLEKAWYEIEIAITNFYQMSEIWDLFELATYLKPQERLIFRQNDIPVNCQPDLILLFKDDDPIIIDWKVHKYGVKDYRQQLALYALALTESPFRKKYPLELAGIQATDIRLKEVQLLTKNIYNYDLLDSEITEIKNLIGTSTRKMKLVLADEDKDFTYLDVPTTELAEKCRRCQFQTICQENSQWEQKIKCQQSNQISFLY